MPYLYSIDRIANGAGRRQDNRQSLVFLEAVRQQTVDGAVVIVDVCLQGLQKKRVPRLKWDQTFKQCD